MKHVNLFSIFDIKQGGLIFRASKEYDTPEEADKYKAIVPDAGWKFVGTIEAGYVPVQTNFCWIDSSERKRLVELEKLTEDIVFD